MDCDRLQSLSTASTCPSQELSRLRTSSWLIGRGRCGKMLWDRALRMFTIGSVRFAFVHGNGHCQLKLKVNCDIHETNIFI
ncbi:hypothetical protein KIN20_030777 [Parelaphostrongylus tenuis]|uniref:Uncharacterized protein n=1 Tax=Parelaphostrongylus tenuis TaxID=148309 RepID=A0AAD5R4N2_PARTN|nr:hypothetical protein KIN20_030777 [Parelaphostrongylus tenuis]